jgi:hypothetical protein
MSTSPLSITLWGPTAFSISMIMIATPFVLYYTQTSTMYTITPSGCDVATYANQTSWLVQNLHILIADFCIRLCLKDSHILLGTQVLGLSYLLTEYVQCRLILTPKLLDTHIMVSCSRNLTTVSCTLPSICS